MSGRIKRGQEPNGVSEPSIVDNPGVGGIHFERKEFLVLVAAQTLALAGVAIDDFLLLTVLLVISWGALTYVCIIHDGKRQYRIVMALLVTVLYLAIGYRDYELKFIQRHHTSATLVVNPVISKGTVEGLSPFYVGETPAVNVSLLNRSDESSIQQPNLGAAIIVVDKNDLPGAYATYRNQIKYTGEGAEVGTVVTYHGSSLIQAPYSTFHGAPLKQDEVSGLRDGSKALCVISSLLWKDRSGSYETVGNQCYLLAVYPDEYNWAIGKENGRETKIGEP